MIALWLLLQQAPAPTVGDTVWVERVLGTVGNAVVRPQLWSLGELGEQLGPAEVRQGARGTLVRYPLALWYPGDHLLTMPGPVLVRRDGSSDTLPASTHRISVLSVLPAGVPRAKLAPKPARERLPLAARSLVPLLVLLTGLLLGWLPAALLWRRRGRRPPVRERVELFPDGELLRRWAAAGEYRAALDGWGWRLARRLTLSRDLEESAALQRLLDEIADRMYVPDGSRRLAELCERAAALDPPGPPSAAPGLLA